MQNVLKFTKQKSSHFQGSKPGIYKDLWTLVSQSENNIVRFDLKSGSNSKLTVHTYIELLSLIYCRSDKMIGGFTTKPLQGIKFDYSMFRCYSRP